MDFVRSCGPTIVSKARPAPNCTLTSMSGRITRVFQKGTDPRIDSYSAFFDNAHRKSTGLADYLKEKGVSEVYLMGLATDYCVKFSVLDAVELGFQGQRDPRRLPRNRSASGRCEQSDR